jgi:hypothetical protein
MNPLHAYPAAERPVGAGGCLLAVGDDPDNEHYCPIEELASFALLMAGHGRCVSTDMMLGDRDYAMAQLACARAIDDDPELARVATRLFAYFEL